MLSIDSQILLIFSAIGAINGLLVTGYCLSRKEKVLEYRFLGTLVLMMSVRIFKSVLFFFNPELDKAILQIGLSACFLIGPMVYFYTLFHVRQRQQLSSIDLVHLGALILLVLASAMFFPYGQYPELWGRVLYKVVNYGWLVYLLVSVWTARKELSAFFSRNAERSARQTLLMCVLTGNGLVWLAYYTSSYTSYIVGALSFSFVILLSALLFMFREQPQEERAKYADKKIAEDESLQLINSLEHLMRNEQLYKNANLTMPQVAKRMGMSVPKFSQLLNDNLAKSFPQFVNEYRIDEAKLMLRESPQQTMENISEACGFNSQSTFYSTFKKLTDTTPAKFKATQVLNDSADL